MHYTVIAYRWGWTNAHHYHVAVSADPDRACELAQEECEDRGGKYGVAVLEWSDETTYTVYAYYPSAYGESRPQENQRIEMFEGIGHDIHSAVTTLTLWGPPEEPQGGNVPCPVSPPDWVVNFVREREQRYRFMNAIHEDLRARKAAGLGPRTDKESTAWAEGVSARLQAEVLAMLAKGPEYLANALEKHAERQAEKTAATAASTSGSESATVPAPI